jgi:hypothetical protein
VIQVMRAMLTQVRKERKGAENTNVSVWRADQFLLSICGSRGVVQQTQSAERVGELVIEERGGLSERFSQEGKQA